jgi:pyruvate,water dikinase
MRGCFASLWTDRAIAYRERQGIDQQTVKLAVVVQRMVAAEVAGVLFTANPVTGARDELVIHASPGLGEAVVSGLVTPDYFVLRKRWWGWSIVERRTGRREVVVQPRAAGGTEHVLPDTVVASQPALPDQAALRLARLGAAIQRLFDCPQDIEWAWARGESFILQARPITALPEFAPPPSKRQQLMARMIAELFPIRPYPLDVTTWSSALFGAALGLFALVGIARPSLEQLCVEEDGVVVRLNLPTFWLTPRILLAPLRILRLGWRYNPVHWQADPCLSETQRHARTLEARDLRELSWEGLLATMREAMAIPLHLAGELRRRYYPRALLAAGLLRVALALVRRGDRYRTLLSGVQSKTLEANRLLEELAAQIRSDATLASVFADHEASELWTQLEKQPSGQAFLAELQAYLDRYGHREAAALLVSQPTWKDAPEVMLGILKGLALAEPRPQTERPAWEGARNELLMHPLLRLSPMRFIFLELLTEGRCFLQLREDTHFYGTLLLPVIRRTLLELGRRLVTVGVLDAPEDVFHLKLDELERVNGTWPPPAPLADELRALMVRRKERRATLEGTPLVDPLLFRRTELEGDARLRGTAGSPGIAEGPVRIIRTGAEFGKLRWGEVLVAPYTNPAWTPLFQRAAAVVVDSGSAGSHAAIVAREYGIPAVMGTIDGTRRLVDGEWVRVDGTRGLVFGAKEHSTGHDVQKQSN